MVCLFCTIWAQPSLSATAKRALHDMTQHCSPAVWHEHVRYTFVQDEGVDVAKCIKFLEYLYTTKCDPCGGGWAMRCSTLDWDVEVLKALAMYDRPHEAIAGPPTKKQRHPSPLPTEHCPFQIVRPVPKLTSPSTPT